MKPKVNWIAPLLYALATAAHGQSIVTTNSVQLPMKQKMQIYLLMGQSNMAGRGKIEAEDKTPHPRVLMFTLENNWEAAVEPITQDKPKMLGVGPGLAFGKAMASGAGVHQESGGL